ncbi:hypothetical protein CRG98_042500, partial [Punica granatum]
SMVKQDGFEFYTLVFHHGGVLQTEPHVAYIGGQVDVWGRIAIDHVSVLEIKYLYEEHWGENQFEKCKNCFWLYPGSDMNDGLKSFKNDMDGDDGDDMNIESELYDLEKSKGSVESSKAASSHGKKPKWRAHNQKPKDVFGQSPRDDIAAIPIRRADEATEEVPEDEYHTEELESLKGSEDEEEESKPPEFNEASTFGNVNLELYMLFPNLNVFKEAVRNYTIAQGRPIEFPKNDKVRCRVKCCGEECDWEILCSWAEAYGCYQETKETWTFFLTRLFEDIGHPSVHGWEFISDMQKGLKGALHELCPKANHRFCVKHLEAIIWKHWPNTDLRSKVWDCAKSKIMADFERNFAQIFFREYLSTTMMDQDLSSISPRVLLAKD